MNAPAGSDVLAGITALIREVTGEDAEWVARIRPDTRLDGDLLLDSVEVAALAARLRERYGGRVDLLGLLVGLDIDQLIELTVGDLAKHVEAVT